MRNRTTEVNIHQFTHKWQGGFSTKSEHTHQELKHTHLHTSGAAIRSNLGSVSCPRMLEHVDHRSRGSNQRPFDCICKSNWKACHSTLCAKCLFLLKWHWAHKPDSVVHLSSNKNCLLDIRKLRLYVLAESHRNPLTVCWNMLLIFSSPCIAC